jgi:V/A-type H+-transporting ATPase subunit F
VITSNIAVIGDRDSILCFQAVGLKTFPVLGPEEARGEMAQALKGDYAVIFITEGFASPLEDMIEEASNRPLPSIVLIPNNRGSLGIALGRMRDMIRKAVGADIFREE